MPKSSPQQKEQDTNNEFDQALDWLASLMDGEDSIENTDNSKPMSTETVTSNASCVSNASSSSQTHGFFAVPTTNKSENQNTKKRKSSGNYRTQNLSPEEIKESNRLKKTKGSAKYRQGVKNKISKLTQQNEELTAKNKELQNKLKKLEEELKDVLQSSPLSSYSV